MEPVNPKLRQPIEMHPSSQGDIPGVLLQDPLALTDLTLFIPQSLAALLTLCDGTRDVPTLRTALMLRTGVLVGDNAVEELLQHLDQALMLENDRYATAQGRVRDEFRAAPCRPATTMGGSYPNTPEALAALLESHLSSAKAEKVSSHIRGVVCPHIDFPRGFPVYAGVWKSAREAVKQAELAIILGTDHNSLKPGITLTRQSYATPFGLLPTAQDVVYEVAQTVGDEVFTEELHHRGEHSIEAAAIWLHHLLGDSHCAVVPALCGSLLSFLDEGSDIGSDEKISRTVGALAKAHGARRTLVVAAADLAHAGPAFGDPLPVDLAESARHTKKDETLMGAICAGDAAGFFRQVKDEGDRRNVCGLAPIYWSLRLLGPARGVVTGYEQCPADSQGKSMASILGIVLH